MAKSRALRSAAQALGAKGGRNRAKKMTAAERSESARIAALALHRKLGHTMKSGSEASQSEAPAA
jgi:hypothetical protein